MSRADVTPIRLYTHRPMHNHTLPHMNTYTLPLSLSLTHTHAPTHKCTHTHSSSEMFIEMWKGQNSKRIFIPTRFECKSKIFAGVVKFKNCGALGWKSMLSSSWMCGGIFVSVWVSSAWEGVWGQPAWVHVHACVKETFGHGWNFKERRKFWFYVHFGVLKQKEAIPLQIRLT